MIENLVVNGCSFTCLDQRYKSWSEHVAEQLNVATYKNLGMGGAGNRYIAQSTIDYLEHANLNPGTTAIVIMWSGPSRKDKPVSKQWWDYVHDNGYTIGAQFWLGNPPMVELTYWVFSGGMANSWNYNSASRELFEMDYKTTDAQIMCKESLFYFKQLADYLDRNGYQYKFTSFLNYWNVKEEVVRGEFVIENHCKNLPLLHTFDFSHWFFIDENKNTFGEYATNLNQIDHTHHPTGLAHEQFAQEFVIPALKEFL